jgi:hypothetical protein
MPAWACRHSVCQTSYTSFRSRVPLKRRFQLRSICLALGLKRQTHLCHSSHPCQIAARSIVTRQSMNVRTERSILCESHTVKNFDTRIIGLRCHVMNRYIRSVGNNIGYPIKNETRYIAVGFPDHASYLNILHVSTFSSFRQKTFHSFHRTL